MLLTVEQEFAILLDLVKVIISLIQIALIFN